jgi:hypothetical protein
MPSEAIITEPPKDRKNKKIEYVNGAWVATPDYIGTDYWDEDGNKYTVTELGPLPEGAVLTSPPVETFDGYCIKYRNDNWEFIPNSYSTKRAREYPQLGDQLDMIWHAINQGIPLDKNGEFYKSIAAVKSKYPKPEVTTT